MKTIILFVCILLVVSAQAQFSTKKINYNFATQITADTTGFIITAQSVTLVNKGEQTCTIDGSYTLEKNEYITMGGNPNTVVKDTLSFAFTGAGTKKLFVIKETVTGN